MSLERFRKVWAVLPEAERRLTVVVIDGRSITWEAAHREVAANTQLGRAIQTKLEELGLI